MSNEKNLQQPAVEFTDLADLEMEQISGGDKIVQVFNPYSFAAPYGFVGPGFGAGSGGQQQQQQQQGGGNGKKKGHYK